MSGITGIVNRTTDAEDRRVIAQVLLQEEAITLATPATFRLLHAPGRVNAAIVKAIGDAWVKAGVVLDVQMRSGGDYAAALMAGDYDLALVTSREIGANALTYLGTFIKAAGPDNLHYAGNGLRDTTRLAGSSASMWHGILASNREHIAPILKFLANELHALADRLDDPVAVAAVFDEANRARASLSPAPPAAGPQNSPGKEPATFLRNS